MKYATLLLCSICFLLAACTDPTPATSTASENTVNEPAPVNVPINQPGPDTAPKGITMNDLQAWEKSGQVMAFSSFNTELKKAHKDGADWTKSPLLVALQFAGPEMSSRVKTVRAESTSGGESFTKLLVYVEEDGYLDDSVRGRMILLRMESTGQQWQLTKATQVWKCWKNRGHEDYSSTPCK